MVLQQIPTDTISETNALTYAAARVIERELHPDKGAGTTNRGDPPWKRRIKSSIELLRKEVSQLTSAKQHNGKLKPYIIRKYQLNFKGIDEAIEEAKQRLMACSYKLKRYQDRCDCFHENRIFRTNAAKIYSKLKEKTDGEEKPPNNQEVE